MVSAALWSVSVAFSSLVRGFVPCVCCVRACLCVCVLTVHIVLLCFGRAGLALVLRWSFCAGRGLLMFFHIFLLIIIPMFLSFFC